MKYIVCLNDMDPGACVEAIDEFDAVTQFQKEMGLGDVSCDVYSAGLCRPRIDIIEVLNDWGENNPEYSPLNEPWSTYIGSDSLDALQKGLNKLIEEHVQPWYASDQLVLRYRPPAEAAATLVSSAHTRDSKGRVNTIIGIVPEGGSE